MGGWGKFMNINLHTEFDSDYKLQIAYNNTCNIVKLVSIKEFGT
jgi:hypothetical protein